MFRHFGQDPTPADIMRDRAPPVFEWVARMWGARPVKVPKVLNTIPEDMSALLREACETDLVQLAANAAAYGSGKGKMEMVIQGCTYSDLPVSRYRVWCLEELRRAFAGLGGPAQTAVRDLLPYVGADILWAADIPEPSHYNEEGHALFGAAINVYAGGTP